MIGIRTHRRSAVAWPAAIGTEAILGNVVWIVDRLDRRALAELGEAPVLELVEHVSVGPRSDGSTA